MFEEFSDKWAELPALSKVELCFATARVALVAAPMTIPVLKRILFLGLTDSDLTVVDAARLVHNAFGAGVDTARALVSAAAGAAPAGAAAASSDARLEELVREFNTLAVLYEQPARTFVDASAYKLRPVPASTDAADGNGGVTSPGDGTADGDVAEGDFMDESAEAQLLDLNFGGDDDVPAANGAASSSEPAATSFGSGADADFFGDLGGGTVDGATSSAAPAHGSSALDDLGFFGASATSSHTANAAAPDSAAQLGFDPDAAISKEQFQAEWAALEGTSATSSIALPGDKAMALMTQQPAPFAGVHAAVADDNIKARCCAS